MSATPLAEPACPNNRRGGRNRVNSFLDEPDSDDDPPPFAQGVMRAVDAGVLERKPNGGNGAAQHDKIDASGSPPVDFPPWVEADPLPEQPAPSRTAKPRESAVSGDTPDYLNWGDLQNQTPPDRRWILPGWIGQGHATLLVGPGATGKTLLAQQILSCLALGRAFIGEAPEQPINCLMWACEDEHAELWRRQVAITRWLKCGLDDFQGRLFIEPRFGKENTLFAGARGYENAGWTGLLSELEMQAQATDAQVIVLDNVGQLFGGNENSRYEVTRFINGLCGALPGRSVILLAHPAKGQGSEYSGNTAWENCVRTRLYLGPEMPDKKQGELDETDADVRYFAKRKTNYSTKDYRILRFTDGLLIPDAVESQGGMIDGLRLQRAESVLMREIKTFSTRGIRTQPGARSPDNLVKLIMAAKANDGLQATILRSALAQMLHDGKVFEIEHGRNSKREKITTLSVRPD